MDFAHSARDLMAPSAEDVAEQNARLALVNELPERQRRFAMRRGLGERWTEIAEAENTSMRIVQTQLAKGDTKLARLEAGQPIAGPRAPVTLAPNSPEWALAVARPDLVRQLPDRQRGLVEGLLQGQSRSEMAKAQHLETNTVAGYLRTARDRLLTLNAEQPAPASTPPTHTPPAVSVVDEETMAARRLAAIAQGSPPRGTPRSGPPALPSVAPHTPSQTPKPPQRPPDYGR